MDARTDTAPPPFDVTTPHPARVYNYWLGGKDNFAADRQLAETLLTAVPEGLAVARANREFALRAVGFMAADGIDQFVDLGTGIPAFPTVHDMAWHQNPQSRVIYVDHDPIVCAHNRALLTDDSDHDRIGVIQADIRTPEAIFDSDELRGRLDLSRPIGLLCAAVWHFVPESDHPARIMRTYGSYLASGSRVAISHITSDDTPPEIVSKIQEEYGHASAPAVFRTLKAITQLFYGGTLLHPGLVDTYKWRPTPPTHPVKSAETLRIVAGVSQVV